MRGDNLKNTNKKVLRLILKFFIEVNYFLNLQNYSIDFLQYKAPKEIFKIRRSHIHFRLQEAFAKDQEVYSLQEDKKKKKKNKKKKVNI
jgi:hypothetical protein